MPIVYIILVIYSFIASQIHWPFGNLALILGFMLLLLDVVIQVIRLALKKTTYHVFLLALSLCFLSVGYLFLWLFWPGMKLMAWASLILALPGIILSFKLKGKAVPRRIITGFLFAVVACFSLMKTSALYCFKNNISSENPVNEAPVFMVHRLAFLLYHENEEKRAEELLHEIQDNLNQKTAYFRALGKSRYMLEVFVKDSAIVSTDLEQVEHGNWSYTPFLLPEDIPLSELN
ncbi:hypothetical protein D3C87_409160 [compost metagenome]